MVLRELLFWLLWVRKLLMADVVAVVAVAEAVQAAPVDTVATAVCAKITTVLGCCNS